MFTCFLLWNFCSEIFVTILKEFHSFYLINFVGPQSVMPMNTIHSLYNVFNFARSYFERALVLLDDNVGK